MDAVTAAADADDTDHAVTPVLPYTFADLLERRFDPRELSVVFHVHVPKAGGGSVHALLRRNDYYPLDFDMNMRSFFTRTDEAQWFAELRAPAPRRRSFLTGHYRLDVSLMRRCWMPHVIMTTLREPISRVLSHYNFTVLVKGNPWHDELRRGEMTFIEYAAWLLGHGAVGPQYGFFDDTGDGGFAYTGTASVGHCLDNLLGKVGVFGFTDRLDEFCVLFGYLLRRPILTLGRVNETDGMNWNDLPLKSTLADDERRELTDMLADDLWFYSEARAEYDRRIADPRIKAVFDEALPHVRAARAALTAIAAIADPGDPTQSAFSGSPAKTNVADQQEARKGS